MNYLDILLGSIALAGVVWMSSVILAARQRQACARLLFLAVIDGICGLTNLVLGAGHLTAVVVRALRSRQLTRTISGGTRSSWLVFLPVLVV
jgi:hypothetical protein